MRILFAVLRVIVAAGVTAAIVAQLVLSVSLWNEAGVELGVYIQNFFSFFTIESNVLTVVVGLVGAVLLITRRGEDPTWFNSLRAATATYMIVTGIVYNLLLRGIELPQGTTVPWSNEVLHVVGPLWMLLDWFLAPGRKPIDWRKGIFGIIAFPLVWVVYTLIRGPITADPYKGLDYWYPYPFLNPTLSQNGYLSVAFYVILIAVIIGITAAGVVWVSRRRKAVSA